MPLFPVRGYGRSRNGRGGFWRRKGSSPHKRINLDRRRGALSKGQRGQTVALPIRIHSFDLLQAVMDRSWILDSQLTRHDPNPVLTRLHPQTRKWAKQRFDPFDRFLDTKRDRPGLVASKKQGGKLFDDVFYLSGLRIFGAMCKREGTSRIRCESQ